MEEFFCQFPLILCDHSQWIKYTNPALGILDFCKQKLTAPPLKLMELTYNGLLLMEVSRGGYICMASTDLMVLSAWPLQTWWFYLHNIYLKKEVLRKVLKNGKKKNRNMYKLKTLALIHNSQISLDQPKDNWQLLLGKSTYSRFRDYKILAKTLATNFTGNLRGLFSHDTCQLCLILNLPWLT